MAARIEAPTHFTATDRVSKVLNGIARNVKSFSSRSISYVNRLDRKVTSVFTRMGRFTQLALGVGFSTLLLSAATDVTTFETGLTGVSKTTGATGEELKKLGADTIGLSKKLKSVSTEKLLELAQSAGQLGVSGSENILRFSETLAELEKASDVAGEEGASSIARLLTITGEGVGVVDRFGSALVALGNNSAATENEILGMSSEVARSTAAYKLSSVQILGMSTALKSLDVRAEAGGTAVGKVFRGIEMATIKGGKVLGNYSKVMGVTSEQVKDTFAKDPQKAFNIFLKGLNRISNEGGSVAKTLAEVGLSGETVSKGIVPLATNYALLEEKMKLANKGFTENIALNEEFDTASKTAANALEAVKIGFSNVIIQTATAGSGLSYVQDVLFYVAENMDTVVAVGAGLIGLFLAMKIVVWGAQAAVFAYNVVLGLSTFLTQKNKRALIGNAVAQGTYRVAMLIGTAATWLATTATAAFSLAMNSAIWPILLVVAAIAAVIAIFYYWDNIVAWFSEKWATFTEWISEAWGRVVDYFQNTSLSDMFRDLGSVILQFVLTPIKGLLQMLTYLPGKVGDLAQSGLDKISNIGGELNVNDNTESRNKAFPSTAQSSSESISRSYSKSSVGITIKDKGGNVESVESDDNNIPISLGSTLGAF